MVPETWCIISLTTLLVQLFVVVSEPQVPCFFIFGDSLFDNGNNNQLLTLAKADYSPYGVDFAGGPTGRFTNGRNTADFIAELLGFDGYIPAFATAKGEEILEGVNYASGAAGIRDETGQHQGVVLSFTRQLKNHQVTAGRLEILLGNEKAAKQYLNKCLYLVGMGNNDYLNNYLLPQYYPSSHLYTPDQYAAALIQQYSKQLKTLHDLGARQVAVFSVGQLGLIPMYSSNATAVAYINAAVQLFNQRLTPLLDELNNNFSDAKYIYLKSSWNSSSGDSSRIAGITVVDKPCCQVSPVLAKGQCVAGQIPCSNRGEYYFFDNFHPTEVVNQVTASRAYRALQPTEAYPFDISHLIQYFTSGIDQVNENIEDNYNRKNS